MPPLNWIGKEAVVKHHKEVPFRLLEPVPELSCGPADSGNLIVQGDNLHALKALLPRYSAQVKCFRTVHGLFKPRPAAVKVVVAPILRELERGGLSVMQLKAMYY